ncbi:MAG: hypothetical protein ACR2JE_13065 [Acidobacteriaceae bacterium]
MKVWQRFYNQRMRRLRGKLRIIGSGWIASAALVVAMIAPVAWSQHNSRAAGPQMSQQQSAPGPPWMGPGPPPPGWNESNPDAIRQNERMMKARNTERQEQLQRDTNKLLALATELKTEVDRTNKNMLSVDVVKKAEQIEKLAKSVKEKMRQ